MNRSRCTGHRVGVTQRPHRKAIFLRPVKTGLWTNLDCRSSHEASRPTAADRHSGGFNFLLRKRLCRVDVRIPGPNVPRGKGVDTHAINLGGLRAEGTLATYFAPVRFRNRAPPRGVAVTLA